MFYIMTEKYVRNCFWIGINLPNLPPPSDVVDDEILVIYVLVGALFERQADCFRW
jgi:hypothetical protein